MSSASIQLKQSEVNNFNSKSKEHRDLFLSKLIINNFEKYELYMKYLDSRPLNRTELNIFNRKNQHNKKVFLTELLVANPEKFKLYNAYISSKDPFTIEKKILYKSCTEAIQLGLSEECVKPEYITTVNKNQNIKTARYFVANGLDEFIRLYEHGSINHNWRGKGYLISKLSEKDTKYKLCFVNTNGNGLCLFNAFYIFFCTSGILNRENLLDISKPNKLKDFYLQKFEREERQKLVKSESSVLYNEELRGMINNSIPYSGYFLYQICEKYKLNARLIDLSKPDEYIETYPIKDFPYYTNEKPLRNENNDCITLINLGVHYVLVLPFIKNSRITTKDIRCELSGIELGNTSSRHVNSLLGTSLDLSLKKGAINKNSCLVASAAKVSKKIPIRTFKNAIDAIHRRNKKKQILSNFLNNELNLTPNLKAELYNRLKIPSKKINKIKQLSSSSLSKKSKGINNVVNYNMAKVLISTKPSNISIFSFIENLNTDPEIKLRLHQQYQNNPNYLDKNSSSDSRSNRIKASSSSSVKKSKGINNVVNYNMAKVLLSTKPSNISIFSFIENLNTDPEIKLRLHQQYQNNPNYLDINSFSVKKSSFF